jgi:hypothetical protein
MERLLILKQKIFDYVDARLGVGMIDVELDPIHYETAYERAIGNYRQRAQNAHEESYVWLTLEEGQNIYVLPTEVTEVRQIFRRTMGMITGSNGASFDPFGASVINNYLLQYDKQGGLATYDFYAQKLELANRMFGGFINFTFNPSTKEIKLVRNVHGTGEVVLLWTYNLKPEIQLLTELQISQWIKDFTYSAAKEMVGEARSKFQQIGGPQGGTSLNGEALKQEAKDEIEKLLEDLRNFIDGSDPLTWVIG